MSIQFNMLQMEKHVDTLRYGAQPPIELLRHLLDFRGLYDRRQLYWKDIQDVNIVAACAPPGGGRNNMTPRFIRHFNILCIQPPSEQSLRVRNYKIRSLSTNYLEGYLWLDLWRICRSFQR